MKKSQKKSFEPFTEEEKEYNNTSKRYNELSSIRIYDDKRVEELQTSVNRIEQKVNKLISMLTAHDYACKEKYK